MPVQPQGFSLVVQEVEANTRAARVTQRPFDVTTLGAYALSTNNGTTVMAAGIAAASEIYQFRWTHASNLALLRSIRFSMGSVTAFAAGQLHVEAVWARAFTAVGTGGATATITGNNGKKRTSFATTGIGEIRTATTAALGAGTKTLDTQGFGSISMSAPTTVGPIITNQYLWTRDTADEYPHTFSGAGSSPEGFIIRVTLQATGTWYFGVTTEWAEATLTMWP